MKRGDVHKLNLYRLAVQHPEAEVRFLLKTYRHYSRHAWRNATKQATRLREDFAGTAAVAGTFVALHENHRALAVECDRATFQWAVKNTQTPLGDRAGDLHLLWADVMDIRRPFVPGVDIVAALNFSTFIYHTPAALRAYFFAARHTLLREGILVIDAYGGPGAMRVGQQQRTVGLPDGRKVVYTWDQRSYDALTNRVDCRIHFALPGGRTIRNAFRYNWRLWTLPELTDLMLQAGFTRAEVWCDRYDLPSGAPPARAFAPAPGVGRSDGVYRPIKRLPAREDWVAYVVGVK